MQLRGARRTKCRLIANEAGLCPYSEGKQPIVQIQQNVPLGRLVTAATTVYGHSGWVVQARVFHDHGCLYTGCVKFQNHLCGTPMDLFFTTLDACTLGALNLKNQPLPK